MEVDRITDLVGKPLEHADRLERQPDVGLVGKLMTDAAGVLPGRTGRQHLLALEHDDVGDTAAGEMIRDAGAHAATADNDHVSS